jgi:hypothetical protein
MAKREILELFIVIGDTESNDGGVLYATQINTFYVMYSSENTYATSLMRLVHTSSLSRPW